jgi:hypothetical protein
MRRNCAERVYLEGLEVREGSPNSPFREGGKQSEKWGWKRVPQEKNSARIKI